MKVLIAALVAGFCFVAGMAALGAVARSNWTHFLIYLIIAISGLMFLWGLRYKGDSGAKNDRAQYEGAKSRAHPRSTVERRNSHR